MFKMSTRQYKVAAFPKLLEQCPVLRESLEAGANVSGEQRLPHTTPCTAHFFFATVQAGI